MCKQDTESVTVAPDGVLSNRMILEGTHLTRFSPEAGVISEEGLSLEGVISVHRPNRAELDID